MENIIIRPVTAEDAGRLAEIYSYYVEETAVSFETETPSVEEFTARIRDITAKYPYLVACNSGTGRILGYTYAHAFVGRKAYDISAELTIYLDRNERRRGLGRQLYSALEPLLAEMGIRNLYACIGIPAEGDSGYRIDRSSERFHRRMGFETCGEFHRCGMKFGQLYSMIWMEKLI